MSDDSRTAAERRLAAALAKAGAGDPRPALRERLRALRERAPEAFEGALAHYEERVLPALADGDGGPALATWIAYGRFVGELEAPGRTLALDAVGRAREADAHAVAGHVVLHLPDDAAIAALVILAPAQPTPAQHAAIALLVDGRVSL